jgi:hypothetical protein
MRCENIEISMSIERNIHTYIEQTGVAGWQYQFLEITSPQQP